MPWVSLSANEIFRSLEACLYLTQGNIYVRTKNPSKKWGRATLEENHGFKVKVSLPGLGKPLAWWIFHSTVKNYVTLVLLASAAAQT